MKRASLERGLAIRVWREHLRRAHPAGPVLCDCEFQIGRFRKGKRIGGCGRSRCFLCHGEKLMKRPTLQQTRSTFSFHEWLRDLQEAEASVANIALQIQGHRN